MPKQPQQEKKEPPYRCSQCGKDCGRQRICRLRLYHKYIAFLIDKELEKISNANHRG